MDSAALYHSISPSQTPHQARLCLSMGIRCLRSMARALHIPYDSDPLPTAGTRLTKEEFEDGFRRLHEVNWPAERDLDESWRNFQGWRVNYEPIVDALDAPHHAAAVAVVRGPARARRGGVAGRHQPHARGARRLSVVRQEQDLQDPV